ncbi:ig-like domain-containing protein [Nephila pilipes]|uniref:Ig-like domain-containing protein n=1 Tax=Nephila pilipes TaxID=299642 RepID=A0A8X6U7Z4_NEPPI|nr:ig-like domain-containing protein [Nephila pilipes]
MKQRKCLYLGITSFEYNSVDLSGINITQPHRVAITPPELRLEVGKTATLNCSVFGNPSGTVIWKKDMMTMLPSPRVIFPNPYLLQVRQIRRQDAGMYQCFVQRDIYSSQAAARIIIGGNIYND